MENRDPFFDFLEATAGQVEVKPPDTLRKAHLDAMEAEALRLKRVRRRNRSRGGAALFLLLLMVSVALLWRGDHQLPASNVDRQAETVGAAFNHPADNQHVDRVESPGAASETSAANDISPIRQRLTNEVSAQPVSSPAVRVPSPPSPILQPAGSTPLVNGGNNLLAIESKACGSLPVWSAPAADLAARQVPAMAELKRADTVVAVNGGRKSGTFWFPGFSAGLHYTPEYMFNALDQTDRLVHNAGLEILWKKTPFSIRSGVSVSVATGVTELAYSYNENLGLKQQLDSVLFAWDPQDRKIVPTWFFSEQSVFDTAVEMQTKAIRKRYTYLQIPLILGYDFAATDRISFGLRAGPVLQLLIDTKQLDADPGTDNNRVISINQITPGRLSTHWQGLVGLNSSFILTRRLSIELEPHVKYYFNSVYEKTTATRKPWSVELRTALIIKL